MANTPSNVEPIEKGPKIGQHQICDRRSRSDFGPPIVVASSDQRGAGPRWNDRAGITLRQQMPGSINAMVRLVDPRYDDDHTAAMFAPRPQIEAAMHQRSDRRQRAEEQQTHQPSGA